MPKLIGKAFSLFGIVSLICLGSQATYAQDSPKDPSRFQHFHDLFHQRRCQEAWDELWKLARAKDYYALYILTGTALGRSIILRGADLETLVKIHLAMEVYATLTSESISYPFSIETIRRDIIPATISVARSLDRAESRKVIDCFSSAQPAEVCVRLAIERHLIPEYEAFIAKVESLNRTTLHVDCANLRY